MVPVPTAKVWTSLARSAFLGAAVAVAPGCAWVDSIRNPNAGRPVFGTETAANEPVPDGRNSTGDAYADHFRRPEKRAEAGPTEALVADARPDGRPSAAKPADGQPQVALRAPVTLPASTGDGPWRTQADKVEEPAPGALTADARPPAVNGPAAAPAPAEPAGAIDNVLGESRRALDALASYQVAMTHQERVGDRLNPPENVVLSIRRAPRAVRLEWKEGEHQGREVIYAADAFNGQMHVHMGDSKLPLPRISMPPDSPLATKNSRHPITEAGFDTIVANMEAGLRKQRTGDVSAGKVRYEGREQPDGYDKACDKVVRETPSNEVWVVYLDPDTKLPALVQATAGNGDLLERYVFRNPVPNPADLASADAFNPDARWGAPKGLLGRLARTNAPADDATRSQ